MTAVLCWFVVLLLPVSAEVMDKELSVPQIWQLLGFGVGLCILSAAIWRWLVAVSFLYSLMPLAFAWTEWFDPSVGPAIAHEAGPDYGINVIVAILLLQASCIFGWYMGRRFSVVAIATRGFRPPDRRSGTMEVIFALLLLSITLLGASSGFGPHLAIWISPPVLFAIVYLVWAFWRSRGAFAGASGRQEPNEVLE